MTKTAIILLILLAAGLFGWYFYSLSAELDELEAELNRKEGEAVQLQQAADEAEAKRVEAVQRHAEVEAAEKQRRARLAAENRRLNSELETLRSQQEILDTQHEADVSEIETLATEALTRRSAETLATAYPHLTPEAVATVTGEIVVNRPYVEGAMRSSLEVLMLRESRGLQDREIGNMQAQLDNKQAEVASHTAENAALKQRCESCERALEAAKTLEENMSVRLDIQAERMRKVQQKQALDKIIQLELFGFSLRDAAIGYGIGRLQR